MPERIQRMRAKGWRMPAGARYVGRGSQWGNPWQLGEPLPVPGGSAIQVTRLLAVTLFREYVTQRGWCDAIREDLAGLDLTCWCPLDRICHADVLGTIANGHAWAHWSPVDATAAVRA
jgi:hypothetical protein